MQNKKERPLPLSARLVVAVLTLLVVVLAISAGYYQALYLTEQKRSSLLKNYLEQTNDNDSREVPGDNLLNKEK
ncbi:hypothetical protein KBC79_03780 [Candidatus Woesebacteria bacterium]|nr:hypothetical protein [Candidatus Woesebacteria bacterium]